MILSPVKHKQTKTTQQQIQSHLKKVDVSRFLVVSNEATKELNSVAVNKHSQNMPRSLQSWCYFHHLGSILKQMAPQELDKVLSIESFAEVTKRNGDGNEPNSLKIMPLNGMKKKRTIHWASCTRKSFTTQKKSIPELHRMHLQTPSPKTMKSLSLNHRRKKGLPSLIQATRIELLFLK